MKVEPTEKSRNEARPDERPHSVAPQMADARRENEAQDERERYCDVRSAMTMQSRLMLTVILVLQSDDLRWPSQCMLTGRAG